MNSADLGTFPCHITLPNPESILVTKSQLQKKILSPYERFREPCKETISKQKDHCVVNKRTTVSSQSLI